MSECTPRSPKVEIWLWPPRSTTPICASLSISFMNRTHRVHMMQRLRFSMSVGPKSTSALTPSPSNVRRWNSMRLPAGPKV